MTVSARRRSDPVPGARPRARAFAERLGAKSVWVAAAVVGLPLLVLLAWQLLTPRELLAGSNSVAFRAVAATVEPGRELCVDELNVPADAAGIRFAGFLQQPRATADVTVTAGDRTRSAVATGAVRPDGPRVEFDAHFRAFGGPAASLPARACITPRDGQLSVGGMSGLQGDQRPARLDGADVANRVSVWFLTAEGERRSLLSAAGDLFERAALFRPGWVGPWTYWLLLLLVLPAASLAAVALLARAAAGLGTRRAAVATVALLAFVNAGAWALVTPAFNGPDEGDHAAFVQHIAETGGQLRAGAPPYSGDMALALDGVRTYSQIGTVDGLPPWLAADEEAWRERRASTPHPSDNGGGPTVPTAPNTALYYGSLAPAYALAGDSPFAQLTAVRLLSALYGVIVAVCAWGIVRELLPRRPFAAAGAGLLVAFAPMLTFMAGVVNNDSGVNAAAALALYLLIRALRRGPTWPVMLGLGLALAALPLMKSTGLALYPPAALGLGVLAWRHHRRTDLPAWASLGGAFTLLAGGWALLIGRGDHASGAAGSSSSLANVELALELPRQFLVYVWQFFLPRLPFMNDVIPQAWPFYDVYVKGGWAAFGWLTIRFPEWVYVAIAVTMGAVGLLAVAAVVRERAAARARWVELTVLALVPVCVLLAVSAALFGPGARPVPAEQGRYAFTAVAALATIAVGGTFGLGRRWHVPVLTGLVVATVALTYGSRVLTLEQLFT